MPTLTQIAVEYIKGVSPGYLEVLMIAIFPELASSATSGNIENLVCLVRRYFGDEQTYAPVIDLFAICERMGLPVQRMEHGALGTLVARDPNGRLEVAAFLSPAITDSLEVRFHLAHLIGHFFLHVQAPVARGEWRDSGYCDHISPLKRYENSLKGWSEHQETNEALEDEADQFAAALLLPGSMVKRGMQALKEVGKVADFFGVTEHLLSRRLEYLGLLEDVPSSFIDAERRIDNSQRGEVSEALFVDSGKSPELKAPENINNVKRTLAASTWKQEPASSESVGPSLSNSVVSDKSRLMGQSSIAHGHAASPAPALGSNVSAEQSNNLNQSQQKKSSGMDLLRRLARQIDSSVP